MLPHTLLFLATLSAAPRAFGSFCGDSAIPFSFEALSSGHPVLGCARPNCFGWDAFAKALNESSAAFHRVLKRPDGFLREQQHGNTPRPLDDEDAQFFSPQTVKCSPSFGKEQCALNEQWMAGIAPMADPKQSPLMLRCCEYASTKMAVDRGVAEVRSGQIVFGGEVAAEGDGQRQFAFDYVANVERVQAKNGGERFLYEVSIQRMPCLPRPEQLVAAVENGVGKELLRRLVVQEHNDAVAKIPTGNSEKQQQQKQDAQAAQPQTKSKKKHEGSAKVIKTSNLMLDSERGQVSREVLAQPPFAAGETLFPSNAIEGPFTEDQIEPIADGDVNRHGDEEGGTGPAETGALGAKTQIDNEQQHPQLVEQQQPSTEQQPRQPSDRPKSRKRIICDRNATKLAAHRNRRQAECTEVEVELPEGSQVEVEGASYYDPGASAAVWQPVGDPYVVSTGGGGSSFYCFTGDTRVQLIDGRRKRMDQLALGDWVASSDRSQMLFTNVESWIHRLPDVEAEFVRLELDDGRALKLTAQHYIYAARCSTSLGLRRAVSMGWVHANARMVYAEQVAVGDCLFAQDKLENLMLFERRVHSISRVRERGIYAPMTGTGDIVAEGILASCYSVAQDEVLQKSFFNNLRTLPIVERLFGRISDQERDLPGWLRLAVEHVMPFVVPK